MSIADADPVRLSADNNRGVTLPAWTQQSGAQVRFEWGPVGVEAVSTSYVVIVDVLRFTTAVDAAVGRGAKVYPYRWQDASAMEFAHRVDARLADAKDPTGPSLSPVRLTRLNPGDAIVLPSPNGSTCTAIAKDGGATVVAASLRNAAAVANWLNQVTQDVAVIACGERWPDGSLRPSLEDHVGAGAVIAHLEGVPSPEARAAADLWKSIQPDVAAAVRSCASGRELTTRGWSDDLDFSCQVGVSSVVPVLMDGAFVDITKAEGRAPRTRERKRSSI